MKKATLISIHVIYWALYLAIVSSFVNAYLPDSSMVSIWTIDQIIFFRKEGVAMIPPAVICFYLSYFILYKKYYIKRKIARLTLSLVVAALISSALTNTVLYLSFGSKIQISSKIIIGVSFFYLQSYAILAAIHGVLGLIIKGFITGFTDMKEKAELSQKNSEMELALLKAQINPHFLFNTINNIDVLIKKDADKASLYLNKLSDMMRFILYDSKPEKIALEEELKYIQSYVELQKIRTTNHHYVKHEIKGNPDNLQIEPMLFIPFIENAFKHAENKKINHAVNVFFNIEKDQIKFTCENNYSTDHQLKPVHGGLGNDLIKRRLALLYPDKHTFNIEDKNGIYKVALSIVL